MLHDFIEHYPSVPAPRGIPDLPYYRFLVLLDACHPESDRREAQMDDTIRRHEAMLAKRATREGVAE